MPGIVHGTARSRGVQRLPLDGAARDGQRKVVIPSIAHFFMNFRIREYNLGILAGLSAAGPQRLRYQLRSSKSAPAVGDGKNYGNARGASRNGRARPRRLKFR